MKRLYETPSLEITKFATEDILTASNDPTVDAGGTGTQLPPISGLPSGQSTEFQNIF